MKAGYPPIDIKFTDRIMYYNAFDAYHVKHDLSAMKILRNKDFASFKGFRTFKLG